MNSVGVLADLCRETEWIWQRMKYVSRSIASCQHPRLKERLVEEINIYRDRCQNIKNSLVKIRYHQNTFSMQRRFLEELLNRCLSEANLLSQVS